MLALGYDDHPDVAVSIGFAGDKLGRLDDARRWYEKALAADPNHLLGLGKLRPVTRPAGRRCERAGRSGKDQDVMWRHRLQGIQRARGCDRSQSALIGVNRLPTRTAKAMPWFGLSDVTIK